jgi:hypothetical protein
MLSLYFVYLDLGWIHAYLCVFACLRREATLSHSHESRDTRAHTRLPLSSTSNLRRPTVESSRGPRSFLRVGVLYDGGAAFSTSRPSFDVAAVTMTWSPLLHCVTMTWRLPVF